MSKEVTLIDYGIGNLLSVIRAFEYCGAVVNLATTPVEIEAAQRLVLPGVGAFADGMEGLRERGLIEPIQQYAKSGKPLMGICLGMQMLATTSEEFGEQAGLNIIPGRVKTIPQISVDGEPLRIPHIGWSNLLRPEQTLWDDTILTDITENNSVYLVHSFMMQPNNENHLLAYCIYGGHHIAAVIRCGAVYGCQFHPEKSSTNGLAIITHFLHVGMQYPDNFTSGLTQSLIESKVQIHD